MQKSHVPDQPNIESVEIVSSSQVTAEQDHDLLMRRFIRHPSSVPINFDVIECGRASGSTALVNVSRGGLCFYSDVPLPKGARVHIEIPIESPPFEVIGQVTWCHMDDKYFSIGVAFETQSEAYSVRMVEQVCYIEHYRRWVAQSEGRSLSSEEAAQEWVEHYAAEFPKH